MIMTTAFCSKKLSDLTGARFNRLTVVSYAGKKGSNGYGITADKIPTRARAMLESTNRRAGAGQGKPLWQLKEMRVTTDDCECGHGTKNSHRLDDFGGLKCDHCDSSQCIDGFEDADGLPVTQYVDANGYLQDEPTADCYTPTFAAFKRDAPKHATAALALCGVVILGICVIAILGAK